MSKKIFVVLFVVIFVLFYFLYKNRTLIWSIQPKITEINNFEDCGEAGYPIMESYPRQCRTSDGRLFIEEVENILPPCVKTGCSGQVCADQDVITTCEFLPEYACYKTARCERQKDSQCGWTKTSELLNCISKF